MIKSFRHRGLEKFFKTGSKAGIQPTHAKKLVIQLTLLNIAERPGEMAKAGWGTAPSSRAGRSMVDMGQRQLAFDIPV
jgi:proteic killer suppression protein